MKDKVFAAYAAIADREFGIQLPPEKKTLLETRLLRLLRPGGEAAAYGSETEFLHHLKNDRTGRLLRMFAEAITTHHTFFMREADHFRYFRDAVLPWVEQVSPNGDIRTWCAACSTGQEAYTLAMLLEDYFGARPGHWEKTLLATDLSQSVLDFARQGNYLKNDIAALPLRWRTLYMGPGKDDAHLAVNTDLRRQVLYRRFNLITPVFPFRRPFHAIFCRNVMIYFDRKVRQQLARQFYDFLEPGGFLFVGHSEVVERQEGAPFRHVMPSVYRKV